MKRLRCALLLLGGMAASVAASADGYYNAPYDGYRPQPQAYGNYGYPPARPYYGSHERRDFDGGRGWGGDRWEERREHEWREHEWREHEMRERGGWGWR
jgi:hypothetical protein